MNIRQVFGESVKTHPQTLNNYEILQVVLVEILCGFRGGSTYILVNSHIVA